MSSSSLDMGVCFRCSAAIRALGPQGWRSSENPRSKFVTTLPKYQITQVLDCWICTRLSEWLEIQDETSYMKWRNEGLEVEYSVHQRLILEGASREGGLPPLSILMNPTGQKEENACYIELNFISSQGKKPSAIDFQPGKQEELTLVLYVKYTWLHHRGVPADRWWIWNLLKNGSVDAQPITRGADGTTGPGTPRVCSVSDHRLAMSDLLSPKTILLMALT